MYERLYIYLVYGGSKAYMYMFSYTSEPFFLHMWSICGAYMRRSYVKSYRNIPLFNIYI